VTGVTAKKKKKKKKKKKGWYIHSPEEPHFVNHAIMLHSAAFGCRSIRIGRSIQGKVLPEIVLSRVELKKVIF
jgi:hypothetical protein